MSTPSLRKLIEAHGGTVHDTRDGIATEFPDAKPADAKEIEAAIQRAREYETVALPVWRERGEGWFVSNSHEEHPGCWYLGQIDERTGQPIRCECVAGHVCHHLGSAVADWRERSGWYANDAAVGRVIEELEPSPAWQRARAKYMETEMWT